MLSEDRRLWKRYQSGDTEALGELYDRHYEKMVLMCMKYVKDRIIAQEIVQETILQILEDGKNGIKTDVISFLPWIRKRMMNRWLNYYQKTENRKRILDKIRLTQKATTTSFPKYDASLIEKCIESIENASYRQLIVLVAQSYSNEEIAQIMGRDKDWVRRRKPDAKRMFRDILEVKGLL